MNSFNIHKRKVRTFDAFLKDAEKSEKGKHIVKGEAEIVKNAMPGIKLNPKNKLVFCMEMRRLVRGGRIIPNEKNTFNELMSFGINKKGSYSSQIGHDDIAMTIVNTSSFFGSNQYMEMVEDIYDTLDEKYKKAIAEKLRLGDSEFKNDDMDTNFLKDLMS